jgi:hypothetical protein
MIEATATGAKLRTVLNKHRVSYYYYCTGCGSLQTEKPHWLAEAYAPGNLSKLDNGAE